MTYYRIRYFSTGYKVEYQDEKGVMLLSDEIFKKRQDAEDFAKKVLQDTNKSAIRRYAEKGEANEENDTKHGRCNKC